MVEKDSHLTGEQIECYSRDECAASELDSVEEHLLLCETCRGRVAESDRFERSMRSASAEFRKPRRKSWLTRPFPVMVPAFALAAVLFAVVMIAPRFRPAPAAFAVQLTATRGPVAGSRAPAGAPLVLTPDLTGLPSSPAFSLEVVDSSGRSIWRGQLAAAARGVTIPQLRSGAYFVRVYSPQNALLREYGLKVEDR